MAWQKNYPGRVTVEGVFQIYDTNRLPRLGQLQEYASSALGDQTPRLFRSEKKPEPLVSSQWKSEMYSMKIFNNLTEADNMSLAR
jgi:hypothetical protein